MHGQAGRRRTPTRLPLASLVQAEFGYKANPKMDYQLGYALKQGIDLMILFGEDELNKVRFGAKGGGGHRGFGVARACQHAHGG